MPGAACAKSRSKALTKPLATYSYDAKGRGIAKTRFLSELREVFDVKNDAMG